MKRRRRRSFTMPMHPTLAQIALRLRPFATRYGLLAVIVVAVPALVYLSGEAGPDEEPFRPLVVVEKPGVAAVMARVGPGRATDVREPAVMPERVKGIYVSTATAGTKSRFDALVALVERTELNALVIDIKTDRGAIAFAPSSEALVPFAAERPPLGDLKEFTAPLKEKGIYLIARQFVFQDPWYVGKRPDLAVRRAGGDLWRDYKGVTWIDPAAVDAWKYNAAIAKEAFIGGFDEVQFDYVRFPSDGPLAAMRFPHWDGEKRKHEVMAEFFRYLDAELRERNGLIISVDLFGLTMWLHDSDLNIGQRLDAAVRHFDAVSPMVYPSHYPTGFNGLANPAVHPYEVVRDNMRRGNLVHEALRQEASRQAQENPAAKVRVGTFRPWLQDFHLGATYTPAMVRGQIRAAEEEGASGWLLWNARNVYTESALEPADKGEEE